MTLQNQDSDYEDLNKAKFNVDILNSDVSMHSSIKSNDLRGLDSDVSFRKKKWTNEAVWDDDDVISII